MASGCLSCRCHRSGPSIQSAILSVLVGVSHQSIATSPVPVVVNIRHKRMMQAVKCQVPPQEEALTALTWFAFAWSCVCDCLPLSNWSANVCHPPVAPYSWHRNALPAQTEGRTAIAIAHPLLSSAEQSCLHYIDTLWCFQVIGRRLTGFHSIAKLPLHRHLTLSLPSHIDSREKSLGCWLVSSSIVIGHTDTISWAVGWFIFLNGFYGLRCNATP